MRGDDEWPAKLAAGLFELGHELEAAVGLVELTGFGSPHSGRQSSGIAVENDPCDLGEPGQTLPLL